MLILKGLTFYQNYTKASDLPPLRPFPGQWGGLKTEKREQSSRTPNASIPRQYTTLIDRNSQGKRRKRRRRKRHASKDRPPQELTTTGAVVAPVFWFGALTRLTNAGGADFAHGGVAGALAGAPHVPTGDGSVGTPTFAKGEEFLGLGHVLFAVGDGPAFFDAEVVDGENVGAAEAEDQEHFDGPGADAADGDEAFDELFVGELLGLFEGGDDAVDGFLREVLHGEDFGARETGFAEDGLSQL